MDKSPVFSATTVGVCSCSSTLYHSSQTLTTLLAWRLTELSTNVLYLAYSRGGLIYQKHCHTSPVSILYGIGALDVGFSIYQYRSENIGHNLAYFFGLF